MEYIRAFLVGGIICILVQILMDHTTLQPGRIMVLLVIAGVILGALGIYKRIEEFGGCGATVPLSGFGFSLFLQCYADLAPKKKFQILNKVINDINNHYPEDGIAKRLDMKSRLREEFTENQAFKVNEIGDKLFGNHQGKKQEFDEKIERYDMQYDTFTVAKENTVKKLEYQMLETDTGIEIKIPMEEYNTKDNVEIIEEPGGGSTIIIKNIENVKIK